MNKTDATREWLIMWCAAIASNSSAKYDAKIKSMQALPPPSKLLKIPPHSRMRETLMPNELSDT